MLHNFLAGYAKFALIKTQRQSDFHCLAPSWPELIVGGLENSIIFSHQFNLPILQPYFYLAYAYFYVSASASISIEKP